MHLTNLDHLVLTVHNLDITVDWYTRVLGMHLLLSNDGRRALQFGTQKINLHEVGHEFEPKAAYPLSGSGDLCFLTDVPMADIQAHLAACNVPVELGPVARSGAAGELRSVYCRDPDGNLIEISNLTESVHTDTETCGGNEDHHT